MKNTLSLFLLVALASTTASAVEIKIDGTEGTPTQITTKTNIYDFTNGSSNGSDVYGKIDDWNYRITSAKSVTVRENVHVMVDFCADSGVFTLEKNSELEALGVRISGSGSVVDGTLSVLSGYKAGNVKSKWAENYYKFFVWNGASITFQNNASLIQTGVAAYNDTQSAINKIDGTVNVGTADSALNGRLKFEDFVYFTGSNGVLNLYSSNKIISGANVESVEANKLAGYKNATTQADSVFFVRAAGAATMTMNTFVDNEFGTIDAYTGSTITLNTSALDGSEGKQALIINNLLVSADTSEEALSLNLLLNLAAGESLQIKNFNELLDDENLALNVKIFNADSSTYEDAVLGKDYAVSSTGWISAIPEPAEWAMIFGAIALAFVAYRRRK